MYWAKTRVLASVGPPAAYPTIIVIGRDGYALGPFAELETAGSATAPAASCKNARRPSGWGGWPFSISHGSELQVSRFRVFMGESARDGAATHDRTAARR